MQWVLVLDQRDIHQRCPDLRPEAAVFPAADEVQAGNFAWQCSDNVVSTTIISFNDEGCMRTSMIKLSYIISSNMFKFTNQTCRYNYTNKLFAFLSR